MHRKDSYITVIGGGVNKNSIDGILQEAQLLLRDRATFVSFENVIMLSSDTVYSS